jgi:hypothetical protein
MLFSKPGLSPTKILVCLAVSVAATPAMANPACGLSLQGCVLPVQDVVVTQPVTTVAPQPVMIAEEPKSFGLLPVLAGLAALGVIAYLLLNDDDDDDPDSP